MGRAKGPTYILPYRRIRERRTDYRLRMALLKSGKPIFNVRRSNRYVYVSIVVPEIGGDKTIVGVSSKILYKKYNWVGLKNTPAAYLTGLLAGKKAIDKGVKEAVVNLGYAWSRRASIPFAAAMGARDAGLDIPIGEEVLVDMSRIRGEHIASYARLLKENNIELYRRRFSKYLEAGVEPENIPELFDKVKDMILGGEDA
jgi:large subunit ribosomal protein L18